MDGEASESSQPTIDADPAGRPGIAVLALRGDVDGCDRPALDGLRRALAAATRVNLDLARLGFAGGTFLGFLAALSEQARARRGSLRLHDVPDRLVGLLAAAGMASGFDLVRAHDVTVLRRRPPAPSAPAADRAGRPSAAWRPARVGAVALPACRSPTAGDPPPRPSVSGGGG